jgi:hypothetical protein
VRFSNTPRFNQIVQLSEDQRIHLADLGAGRFLATLRAFHAAIAFDRHCASRHAIALRMEANGVERAYHCAHRAGDAFLRVDQNEILIGVPRDGARRAHLLARRRIAVPTFAWERRELRSPRGNMNPGARRRILAQRSYRILAL